MTKEEKKAAKAHRRQSLSLRQRFYAYVKRVLSFVIAFPMSIALAPLFVVVAVAIKADDRGPVFFKQLRTGKYGQNFYVYKFRTMRADNDALNFGIENQYTKTGKFLRATSIDELPQLYNIIRGEMCFIGPRPWMTEYYDLMNARQRHRVDVTPGITGLAQAKGRNDISIFEKIDYDLDYIKHYSFKEDVKVVLLSVEAVLSRTGADASKSTIQTELDNLKSQSA